MRSQSTVVGIDRLGARQAELASRSSWNSSRSLRIDGRLLDDQHAGQQRNAQLGLRRRVARREAAERRPRRGGPVVENRPAAPLGEQLAAMRRRRVVGQPPPPTERLVGRRLLGDDFGRLARRRSRRRESRAISRSTCVEVLAAIGRHLEPARRGRCACRTRERRPARWAPRRPSARRRCAATGRSSRMCVLRGRVISSSSSVSGSSS